MIKFGSSLKKKNLYHYQLVTCCYSDKYTLTLNLSSGFDVVPCKMTEI